MDDFDPSIAAPPSDPNAWTDEQWIEWLKATDLDAVGGDVVPVADLASRLARSSGGQALGQAMLGLAQAMYGPKDEDQVIIVEGAEPEDDDPFDVQLDFDHPERSQIVFRPATQKPEQ
jgi:hypothetical protein